MTTGADAQWERCQATECRGARTAELGACLAHLDPADLEGQLRRFGRGRPLDARGVRITPELWQRIVEAAPTAPEDTAGARRLSAAQFDGATIEGAVSFDEVVFRKNASFQGTRFRGPVTLNRVVVNGQAQFSGAIFEQSLSLFDSRLEGPSWFTGTRFEGPASFVRTRFWGAAWFADSVFNSGARFEQCTFENSAAFNRAAFSAETSFAGSDFSADVELDDVVFRSKPSFEGAAFKGRKGTPEQAQTKAIRWWGPPLAPWARRVKASLIDSGVVLGIVGVGIGAAFACNWLGQYLLANVLLIAGPAAGVWWAWRNLAAQGRSGQSLGKRVVGLRLLSERDRRPIGPWRSIARSFAHILDTLPLGLGWIRPLWHPKNQTLADSIMKSVVVVVGTNFARANTADASQAPRRALA